MKNLAIAFCSIRPLQYNEKVCDYREIEYLNCLTQLYRVIPDNFDIVIIDNTMPVVDCFTNPFLVQFLKEKKFILLDTNIGTKNKGMGELHMFHHVLETIDLSQYEAITYVTARRIFTCPYFFERTTSMAKDVLVSNPDFLYLNGKFIESHKKGLYNDMIFSMKTETMKTYSKYCWDNLEMAINNNIGSEQMLYNFIHENEIQFEYLKWIGLIRNDWEQDKKELNINNFHIN